MKKMLNYKNYIESEEWKKKSREFILEDPECEKCGSGFNLTCHHKNYRNLGSETRRDIKILCWNCHKKYHQVDGVRVWAREFEDKLKEAKINYKKEVKKAAKLNQAKTQFIRKGKIKGLSKTKSRKFMKAKW